MNSPSTTRALSLALLGLTFAVGGCSTDDDDAQQEDLTFPELDGPAGKEDAFGRSLVGAPNPYKVDTRALTEAEAFEEELRTNFKARRDFGWAVARKALEPVPLLGLADQLNARPDCPEGVADRSLDNCSRRRDEAACSGETVDDFAICGWDEDLGTCAPVCDNLTLADGSEIPEIPRFQTWYGIEDLNHIFKTAYGRLSDEEQFRREGVADQIIGEAFHDNNTKKDRIRNWPLRRYTKVVDELFGCELAPIEGESEEAYADRCAAQRQSQFSGASGAGGGIARILYSPAMARHMVANYAQVLDCADDSLSGTWCGDGPCEEDAENFSTCFASEFPVDAGSPYEELGLPAVGGSAVVKLTWSRVGFEFKLPAYDTDAAALERRVGEGASALWNPEGDRAYDAPEAGAERDTFPTPDDIYTIETRGGSLYRLTGIHVATKETRHWVWVSMWWSDRPDDDFGADRPADFADLEPAWSNYKMCVAVDYLEGDAEASSRFEGIPSLQAALDVTGSAQGAPTWCSNPYIEQGAGNARTNCIGCHQHAGTRVAEDGTSEFEVEAIIEEEDTALTEASRFPANGRTRRRTTFATDYSWAFSRMDDLTELIRREVEFSNVTDGRWGRLEKILREEGDVEAGEEVFRNTSEDQSCTDCHGEAGGGGIGPNFEALFAAKTQWELLYTVVEGRGGMPTWGDRLSDEQLTDLMAFLSATFANPDVE